MEFQVTADIEALSCEVICPIRGRFIRKGKQRRAELQEEPYLPNYIFANIPAERYLEVLATKGLAKTTRVVSGAEMKRVRLFQREARAEYAEQVRISQNQQVVAEFSPGEAVRFLDGRFGDQLVTFRGVVERAHDLYPKLQLETEMMGRTVKMEADPLDIRKTG
jgi:transcription antitermination factor NusG